MKIYRLKFNSPLHISDVRADYGNSMRQLFSDTLYAAIMDAWAILGKSDWISNNINFALSCLFPFTVDNKGEVVYFFPKPLNNPIQDSDGNTKKIKKIGFIDKEYFENFLLGNFHIDPDNIRGQYLSKKVIDQNFISGGVIPRIRWHRKENEDAEPFYMEKLFFKAGSGMWFMFYGDETARKQIEVALNYLKDAGLGTDRNVGNGTFTYESDELDLKIPEKANYCISLSLFLPSEYRILKEMLNYSPDKEIDSKIGYEIIRRGGWIGEPYNTYRKRNIYMFREGSIFYKKDCNSIFTDGAIVDVKPLETPREINHPIYRSGKAIFLPIV